MDTFYVKILNVKILNVQPVSDSYFWSEQRMRGVTISYRRNKIINTFFYTQLFRNAFCFVSCQALCQTLWKLRQTILFCRTNVRLTSLQTKDKLKTLKHRLYLLPVKVFLKFGQRIDLNVQNRLWYEPALERVTLIL